MLPFARVPRLAIANVAAAHRSRSVRTSATEVADVKDLGLSQQNPCCICLETQRWQPRPASKALWQDVERLSEVLSDSCSKSSDSTVWLRGERRRV